MATAADASLLLDRIAINLLPLSRRSTLGFSIFRDEGTKCQRGKSGLDRGDTNRGLWLHRKQITEFVDSQANHLAANKLALEWAFITNSKGCS
jgi:hypothetical protein